MFPDNTHFRYQLYIYENIYIWYHTAYKQIKQKYIRNNVLRLHTAKKLNKKPCLKNKPLLKSM